MDTQLIRTFSEDHHGLITRSAGSRLGISKSAWYGGVHAGVIEIVHPNVARLVGNPMTRHQQIAAAVLAAQPGAMASHRTAAYLWGIPRPEADPIEVLLTSRSRRLRLAGVIVHHPRDQRDLTPTLRFNIRASNILRLLCDLGAVDEPSVPGAVGHVVTTGLASPAALRNAIIGHSRQGRAGIPALRRALDEWVIDGKPADSVLEPAMKRLLERYDLPRAQFHAVIAGYEVDFWIVDTPVVLECDGWDFHGKTRQQFDRDHDRDVELTAAGYIPIHFTYRQIERRPAKVATKIRRVLERWAPV